MAAFVWMNSKACLETIWKDAASDAILAHPDGWNLTLTL